MLRALPVLPLLASTIVSPEWSRPSRSARSTMYEAIRSLIDPDGLRNSSLTQIPSRFTSGVSPMHSSTLATETPERTAPRATSASHPAHFRVEQGIGGHGCGVALREVLDLHGRALRGQLRWHPRIGDAAIHRIAVGRARDVAHGVAVGIHGLLAHDHGAVVDDEAAETPARPLLAPAQQRGASQEVLLVGPYRKAEPRLVRVVRAPHVLAPGAVALLEAQAVEGAAARGDEAQRLPGSPQEVPETKAQVRRRVELPTELAHVRQAQSDHRHVPDEDPACPKEAEPLVREVVLAQTLHDLYRPRAPQPDAACARGDVRDADGPVRGQVALQPVDVARTIEPELKAIRAEPSHGDVASYPRVVVEH